MRRSGVTLCLNFLLVLLLGSVESIRHVKAFRIPIGGVFHHRNAFLSTERRHRIETISRFRGGSSKQEEEDDESEYDDEEETSENDEYEEEEEDDTEEEESINTEGVRIELNVQKFDEPIVPSPLLSIYSTIGVMYLARKVDLFAPSTVRIVRFAFLSYMVLLQLFLLYARIQAHRSRDQTPIELKNPFSSLFEGRLSPDDENNNNTNGMMKNIASSLLRSSSTVMEYDLQQTRSMQSGLIVNLLMQWFLHFKMEQVQPLVMQTVNGILQLVYNPLFQVHVLGRNLERPFKTAAAMRFEEKAEQEKNGAEKASGSVSTTDVDPMTQDEEEDESDEEDESEEEEEVDEEEEEDEESADESADVESEEFDEDEDFSDDDE